MPVGFEKHTFKSNQQSLIFGKQFFSDHFSEIEFKFGRFLYCVINIKRLRFRIVHFHSPGNFKNRSVCFLNLLKWMKRFFTSSSMYLVTEVKFLCVRYRQVPGLGDITSQFFYEGKVVIKRSNENSSTHSPFIVAVWDADPLPNEERCSSLEAGFVSRLSQRFPFTCGQTDARDEQPHVLTFYVKQSKLLQRIMDPRRVKVIDSAQGSEFRRGIISGGRHDGKAGFLNDRRRVNVALSRFCDQLILVCHKSMLQASTFWKAMAGVWLSLNIIVDVGPSRLLGNS